MTEDGTSTNSIEDDQPDEGDPSLPPKDRHIVRSQGDPVDRYHGPGSLFTLCNDFRDITLTELKNGSPPPDSDVSHQSNAPDRLYEGKALKELLTRICLEASTEESPFDLQSDHIPIRLPPKQFLLVVQAQFFQQVNYATDLFVKSRFRANVERLYSRPFTPADEAWAICLKIIILLVLGSEVLTQSNDPLFGSQFALSFLSSVRTALSNPRFLNAPKLANVQALTLLSIAARQYYPPGFAESILAQACVLARTMGLHQSHAVQDGICPEEAQERINVFRSLYLQDKSSLILRGSICWLPSFDCGLSSELNQSVSTSSDWTARVQLAGLQDEVYRSFHSAMSKRPSSAKQKGALSRIEQGLKDWAKFHRIFGNPPAGTYVADLQLEFLATRISAFSGSLEPCHILQVLDDSRLSCLLLLVSYGKYDQSITKRLDAHLPSRSLPNLSGKKRHIQSSRKNDSSSSDAARENSNATEPLPIQLHGLLDAFSVPAFFILTKNVMWPVMERDDSRAEDDLDLLQRVSACYREYDSRVQTSNQIHKVGCAFERLLEVVGLIKSPRSSPDMHQKDSGHSPFSGQISFGGPQGLHDFHNGPVPSAYAIPPLSMDECSNKSGSRTTSNTPSVGTMTELPTPREPQEMGQPYDSFGQRPFPQMPHQEDMRPPNRKRRLLSEPDVCMGDDPDSRLLSDFLATAPDMCFDFPT
ncbi:MAG: hypothetical protein M1819_005882 [Sarea resinae]|nr:MAG: hypothetical protein M1819_005882 [Sarea resinae]